MRRLIPSFDERRRIEAIDTVYEFAEQLPDYEAETEDEGRKKMLRSVAVRLGQAKFRAGLLEAYDGRCAITGTAIRATLQAAHIAPYCLPFEGLRINSVQNGLLLRADVHNLFDLGLLSIDPETLRITLAPELMGSGFAKLQNRTLRKPRRPEHTPNKSALRRRLELFQKPASR